MSEARTILETFDVKTLPTLDIAVLGALELCAEAGELPSSEVPFERPLVVGSGNARAVAEIMFADTEAVIADESTCERILSNRNGFDGAVLISASGGKHAVGLSETLAGKGIPTVLFTNNAHAPAGEGLPEGSVRVFPKNREPYTYNTSTYMSMLLAATGEDPAAIRAHLASLPDADVDLGAYDAFTFLVPRSFSFITPMVRTKFDELFGPMLTGRVFTEEEVKHAKTVVPSDRECFVSVGVVNETYGTPSQRYSVPVPQDAGYAAMMAITYFIIGRIQAAHPPYFMDNIEAYTKLASQLFNQDIGPIVA